MDDIHDIIELIHHCAFSNRLPNRAESLAAKLLELSPEGRRRAQEEMESVDLIDRMARKAAQLAGCKLPHTQQAANRIADAMYRIFGEGNADYFLKRAGWKQRRSQALEFASAI